MMSDSFLYSSDDADDVRAVALLCSGETVQECRLWSEAGLSVETSLAIAPECGLTFPQECTC